MHILFDARTINQDTLRVSHYAKWLCEALIPLLSDGGHLTIMMDASSPQETAKLPDCLTLIQTHKPAQSWAGLRELQSIVQDCTPDIYWSTNPLILAWNIRVPHIYTVSDDLFSKDSSPFSSWLQKLQWKLYGKNQLLQARRLICSCQVLKDNLTRELGPKVKQKTKIVHPGVPALFREYPPNEIAPVREAYNLPEKYMLFVGEDRQDLHFETLLKALTATGDITSIPIVVAGINSNTPHRIKLVKDLDLRSMVRFIGDIDQHKLAALYSGAWLFLHPSTRGGFSHTILQAMACGAPVLGTVIAENEELFGSAIYSLHPVDPTEWRNAILTLTLSASLREKLHDKSLQKASTYTWQEAARQTLALFNEISGT